MPAATAEDLAELQAILDSIVIDRDIYATGGSGSDCDDAHVSAAEPSCVPRRRGARGVRDRRGRPRRLRRGRHPDAIHRQCPLKRLGTGCPSTTISFRRTFRAVGRGRDRGRRRAGPSGVVHGRHPRRARSDGVGLGERGARHPHPLHLDHAGSAAEVLAAAPDAQGYAGAEDIPHFVAQGALDQHIVVPRPLVPVVDGDKVFDLRIVATPGHTPGHIAVLDEALGVLVVGDALTTTDGRPTSYPIGSTEDIEEAQRSVAKLAALDFETLFVGHGEPIQSGAAALVRDFLDPCPLDHDLQLPAGKFCRFEWPATDEGSLARPCRQHINADRPDRHLGLAGGPRFPAVRRRRGSPMVRPFDS